MRGSRPRVGFVLHKMQVAGAEVLVTEIIRRLGQAIEPAVFCLDAVGPLGEELLAQGVPVVSLDRKPGRDWGVARRLAEEIDRRGTQVMHAHQYSPFFYAALAKPLARRRPKLILTEHGRHYPDTVSPTRRAVNRLFLDKMADEVNACCRFAAEALCRIDGFRGNRIGVVENGIDLERFRDGRPRQELRRQLGLDPARKLVACVARFHPVKDHPTLLRAFAEVPDADLLLIGDGPERANLERLIGELGIGSRVEMLGVRRNVADYLAAADLFALSSLSEAASLTVLEAMACGTPCVLTDVGGNGEIVRDGVEGRLTPRGDGRAMAAAMREMLIDDAGRSAMGRAARRRVETVYSLERTVGRYGAMYRRLAGGG